MASLFPIADVAVMGIGSIVAHLPRIVRRVHQTVDAVLAAKPDVLVIIDSPELTHAVARRVARRRPELPIVDYVSPTVWAWRAYRARRMRRYVDHVLALLPFEPEAHRRLGGPPCTYVGHPLIERLAELRPAAGERAPLGERPLLVVLPGSRRTEIERLMTPFGEAVGSDRRGASRRGGAAPGGAASCRGDCGARRRLAAAAGDRARRGREVRRLPPRPCGARRLRHGDARARARRRSDGRRLSRRPDRAAPEAASSAPRRSCSPTLCSARTPCPSSSTRTARRKFSRARRWRSSPTARSVGRSLRRFSGWRR